MNLAHSTDRCSTCGGIEQPGHTTFTADFGEGVVVVRHVPAIMCCQCGAEWIADDVAEKLEAIVEDARSKKSTVQVTRLTA